MTTSKKKTFSGTYFLETNPAPHRTPTVTRWGTYKGKREQAYIDELSALIKKDLPEDFERFGEYPIKLSYVFGYMPAKSWSKAKKADAFSNKFMVQKPDIDNVMKSTSDVLMQDLITDDKWVVHYEDVKMIYTEKPMVSFTIEEI